GRFGRLAGLVGWVINTLTLMVPKRKSKATETLPLFAKAMSTQSIADDLSRVEGRPEFVSSGLRGLDNKLGGGFPVGGITLIAERPDSGALELVLSATLKTARRKWPIALLSDRRDEVELQRRLTAIEAKVSAYRAAAGLLSAEDRMAMVAARKRVPWSRVAVLAGRAIAPPEVDELVFSYRPLCVVAELRPRAPDATQPMRIDSYKEGVARLASLARRHHVAMVLMHGLPASGAAPRTAELPDRGSAVLQAQTVILAQEADNGLRLEITRTQGAALETPVSLRLRHDVRFDRVRV
ncbi:MAG: hypothetical protein AAF658_20470, partial [Myxococcota bacterium]